MTSPTSPKFRLNTDHRSQFYGPQSPKGLLVELPDAVVVSSPDLSPISARESFGSDRKASSLSLESFGSSGSMLSVDALLSSSNSFGHASRIDAAFKKKRSPVKDTYGLSVTAPLPDARYVQDTRFSPPAPRFAPHQLPLSRADSYYAGNRRDAQVIAEANRYDTGYLPAHARTMPAQQQQQQHHQPYAPATATSNQYRFGGRYDPMQGMGLGNPMPSSYSAYQSTMPPPPQHHPHHHATAAMATAGPYQGKEKSGGKRIAPPLDGYIYQVQFKRAHRNFVLGPTAPRSILPGDFVKVEADRGEDMGVVLSRTPASQFEEVMPTAGYRGRGFSTGQGERKQIYRLATMEEKTSLQSKVQDEEVALQTIREKVAERGLPMTILDAEYQYDRHKMVFYFEAERRIDFRELVSELFSQYKTRIWMQQVDTSALDANDPGTELAKATGFLPDREEYFSGQTSLSSGYGHEDYRRDRSFSDPYAWSESDSFASGGVPECYHQHLDPVDLWDPSGNAAGMGNNTSGAPWPGGRY